MKAAPLTVLWLKTATGWGTATKKLIHVRILMIIFYRALRIKEEHIFPIIYLSINCFTDFIPKGDGINYHTEHSDPT